MPRSEVLKQKKERERERDSSVAVIYSIRSSSPSGKEKGRKREGRKEGRKEGGTYARTLDGRKEGRPHISCQMSAAAGAEISRPPPLPTAAAAESPGIDSIGTEGLSRSRLRTIEQRRRSISRFADVRMDNWNVPEKVRFLARFMSIPRLQGGPEGGIHTAKAEVLREPFGHLQNHPGTTLSSCRNTC